MDLLGLFHEYAPGVPFGRLRTHTYTWLRSSRLSVSICRLSARILSTHKIHVALDNVTGYRKEVETARP